MFWSDKYRQIQRPNHAIVGLIAMLYAAVAGCQPIPQPFAHPEKTVNPIVIPVGDFGGVTLLPVAGVTEEIGRGLTAAMTDALLSEGIIAGPDSSNQRSKFLQGAVTQTTADGDMSRITVDWDLFDGAGKFLGSRKTELALPQDYWLKREKKMLQARIKHAAVDVAELIRGENDDATDRSSIALHIGKVKGVSDKATAPLRRAMISALKKRNFRIADGFEGAGLVITGAIKLGPENAEPRPIRITWSVLDSAGKELGKLTQQNAIPRQELEQKWNSLAAVIADNAAGGVGDMVVQLPPRFLRGGEIPAK